MGRSREHIAYLKGESSNESGSGELEDLWRDRVCVRVSKVEGKEERKKRRGRENACACVFVCTFMREHHKKRFSFHDLASSNS